ncbi:hypothetical protein ACTSKR_11285 [Chitinibacteraceae bacterium HSL-7]
MGFDSSFMTRYVSGDAQGFTVVDGGTALRNVRYRLEASDAVQSTGKSASGTFDTLTVPLRVIPAARLAGGSLRASMAGSGYIDRLGALLRNVDPATGSGIAAGSVSYLDGVVRVTDWPLGNPVFVVQAGLEQFGDDVVAQVMFRTPAAPLRPSSLTIVATDVATGQTLTGSANADGIINTARMIGKVDYQTGVVKLVFRDDAGAGATFDISELAIPGVTSAKPSPVYAETIRYSAVSYTYLPLDADIIGLDPVRLPSDGRVPIMRRGDMVQVMHPLDTGPVTPVLDGSEYVVSLGRTRIAWVRVSDAGGATVPDGYTLDRDNGVVRFASLAGLALPLNVRHTVSDLRMLTDVQISGRLTMNRPLTHAYPAGETIVASCLIHGDRRARVSSVWDQQTWDGVWRDSLSGNAATATLNLIDYPIEVTNEGCDTERWVIRWTSTSSVEVISEHRGLVWSGSWTGSNDLAPINPRTRGTDGQGGVPYFRIRGGANGGGWSAGNVVRLNTVGAIADFWVAQAIQQSDEPAGDGADGTELYTLGNVDRP